MNLQRPDLSHVEAEVLAYIEALESEIEKLRADSTFARRATVADSDEVDQTDCPQQLSEPPTTRQLIIISRAGSLKRTPRHLYDCQRRGGMGVFDLETAGSDMPQLLTVADESESLLVITDQGRAFNLAVQSLPQTAGRAKGEPIGNWLSLRPTEQVAVALPNIAAGYLLVLTAKGHLRRLRHHYFNNLRPGTQLLNAQELGAPVSATWSETERDVFIATRQGRGIRFAERLIPANGCLGIRLGRDDVAVAVAPVEETSGVFMMNAEGKGTIRLMSGFTANKAPGSGGKVAMKTEALVGAFPVTEADDIFAVSRLSKLIRFSTVDVPLKEGVVQGVNCMALRADEVTAIAKSTVRSA